MNAPAPSSIVLVVGVDLTDVSEHLVRTARALAGTVDEAQLHFVHVVAPPPMATMTAHPLYFAADLENDAVDAARGRLELMCARIADDVRLEVFVHTPIGRTCESLAEIARRLQADLVVVEAHDHSHDSLLRRTFHRSTTARLAQTAPCSVLTVRAKEVAREQPEWGAS